MNIAVLSESGADENGLRVLIASVLPNATFADELPLRRRGWPGVLIDLPIVLRGLHFQRPDVDALVVVADSDDEPIHQAGHDAQERGDPDCRLCVLRRVARDTLAELRAVPNRVPLRVGVGLAVPTIEAWYQVARDPNASEAVWLTRYLDRAGNRERRRQLKLGAYGIESLFGPTARALTIRAAERAAARIEDLRIAFPGGFGALVHDLRSW